MNMPFVFRVSDDFRTYSCVVWSLKCPAFYILHHINNKIYASVSDCQLINIEFPFHQGSRDVQCENRTVITITNIIVTGRNKTNPCILNTKDEDSIKSDCDGQESCLLERTGLPIVYGSMDIILLRTLVEVRSFIMLWSVCNRVTWWYLFIHFLVRLSFVIICLI